MWRPVSRRRRSAVTAVALRTRRGPEAGEQRSSDKGFASACYAPTTSMYFDQFGQVRACCQNTGTLLGTVTEQSIREIWESADTRRMRAALARDDYSEGCGFCGWQVEQGDEGIVFARIFDEHPALEEHPRWPVQMEFSMTNSCNLQCVMCNGDWSSSIRAHREHRAPLPEVYGERFFDELAEFLPHLRKVNFLGGEPFLGKEPLRVMGMLAELESPPTVAVTTNGTQWSPRIEAICERLPISFVLSLDGITKETYESIRVGSDFDAVMTNLERFRGYAQRHGTMVSLAHCLMRANWREFSRFLHFAESEGLRVGMNEVLFPAELSLFQLPADQLRAVVDEMERDDGGIAAGLDRLRPVWDGQLDALRHRLAALDAGAHGFVSPWADGGPGDAETWEQQAVRVLSEWTGDGPPERLDLDDLAGSPALTGSLGHLFVRLDLTAASTVDDLLDRLTGRFASDPTVERRYTDMVDDIVISDAAGEDPVAFRVSWNTVDSRTTMLVAVRNPPPPPVLPDDPDAVMAQWCGEDRMVVLRCDPEERIVAADGAVDEVLGVDVPVVGRSTASLFTELTERHGAPTITAGPSALAADTCAEFGDGAAALSLRVMVERDDAGSRVILGRRTPGRGEPAT